MIEFTVYGEPTAKGRPRFSKFKNFVRAYTPKKTLNAEMDFKTQALPHRPKTPIDNTPISVEVLVYKSIPKSFSKKKYELALKGELLPITKPDTDNYIKLIFDSLNGIFWRDDSLVTSIVAKKFYSDRPRIEMKIIY